MVATQHITSSTTDVIYSIINNKYININATKPCEQQTQLDKTIKNLLPTNSIWCLKSIRFNETFKSSELAKQMHQIHLITLQQIQLEEAICKCKAENSNIFYKGQKCRNTNYSHTVSLTLPTLTLIFIHRYFQIVK